MNIYKKGIYFTLLLIVVFILVLKFSQKDKNKLGINGTKRIVCFGDSLTEGVGASKGEDYPSYLSKILNIPVINSGVSGDTTSSAISRLSRDILSYNPDLVIILLGGNDFIQRVPEDTTKDNIEKMIVTLKKKEIKVILVSPIAFYDKLYEKIAKKYNIFFIPHILRGVLYHPDLMSDEIHPNSKGYKIIARKISKIIE